MIRVNLLKPRVVKVEGGEGFEESILAGAGELGRGERNDKAAFINLLLMGVFVILLLVYESINIGSLQQQAAASGARLNKLTQELDQKKKAFDQSKIVQEEIKELEEKIAFVDQLSKTRLLEIKVMDYLQSAIPEKVWLSGLTYKDKRFEIAGFAISESDFTSFVNKLEAKSYFRNVLVLKSQEVKQNKETLLSFEVSANVEDTE